MKSADEDNGLGTWTQPKIRALKNRYSTIVSVVSVPWIHDFEMNLYLVLFQILDKVSK